MAINKVIYDNNTLIDITDTTVANDSDVTAGLVYYRADGTRHVGTGTGGGGGEVDLVIFHGETHVDQSTGTFTAHMPSNLKTWLSGLSIDLPYIYGSIDVIIYSNGSPILTLETVSLRCVGTIDNLDNTNSVMFEATTSASATERVQVVVDLRFDNNESTNPSKVFIITTDLTNGTNTVQDLVITFDLSPEPAPSSIYNGEVSS